MRTLTSISIHNLSPGFIHFVLIDPQGVTQILFGPVPLPSDVIVRHVVHNSTCEPAIPVHFKTILILRINHCLPCIQLLAPFSMKDLRYYFIMREDLRQIHTTYAETSLLSSHWPMKLCSGSVLTLSNCAPFALKQKVYKFLLFAITDFIALILRCALFIRRMKIKIITS